MNKKINIIALSGSLRQDSYNTAAIKAVQEIAGEQYEIEIADISDFPLYNQELDGPNAPTQVQALAKKILAADAILFSTPEYNYSIPGVLKNAIDWLSTQPSQPFNGKPAAIISSSMGMLGGARAQYHLRQVMVFLNVHLINKPEIMIASAHEKFDESGALTDEVTKGLIGQMITALATMRSQLKTPQ